MKESKLLALSELVAELATATKSDKVRDACLTVRNACRARISRGRREAPPPSSPLYGPTGYTDDTTNWTYCGDESHSRSS